jgi:hypothetical protein
VPQALQFYVNRLSFSKNRVRLQALSTNVASANSQIIVRLPSNTMVNLASLTMTGGVRATVAGAFVDNTGVALPTNWDYSFIETLSLIANGGIITQPFLNYKLLGNTLNDVYGTDDKNYQRAALQGSYPQLLKVSQNSDGEGGYQPFAINSWISATQTMAPSYISTNLLGDLELRLTMAGNEIIQTGSLGNGVDPGAGVANAQQLAGWDMNKINFYIETASIQSNMLEQAIAAKLAGGEPINVPFENVFSFAQANDGTSYNQRFSVSSQSVNKIVAVSQLRSDLQPGATRLAPGKVTVPDIFGQRQYVNGIPQALRRNYCQCQLAQFSVNNQYSPNYQIDSQIVDGLDLWVGDTGNNDQPGVQRNYQASNALVEVRAAMDTVDYDYEVADKLCSTTQMPFEFLGLGFQNTVSSATQPAAAVLGQEVGGAGEVNQQAYWFPYEFQSPLETFLQDKWLLATSFDLDVCDKDRLVSGINTLGSNAQMFLNVNGGPLPVTGDPAPVDVPQNNISTIFVLCTSMIQIYQGATLQIIQ